MSEENATVADVVEIREILDMIPHRYPLLLVDRVEDMVPGKSAVGIKNVTFNEPQFQGHFPGAPIMPGVMIVEAMAQTAAVLVVNSLGEEGRGKLVYFMTIDKCRFRKPVTPGDQLKIHVETVQNRGAVWKFTGKAKVDGQVVSEASFGAMIVDND